jgi:D-tagatose-1,6-bisphosphate aldolase subunit GatZ/KbaZ
MDLAETQVRAYAAAGYTKLHLDCSMPLPGDTQPLSDEVVAARAARLLAVAETAARESATPEAVSYVIGTEVPVPGGAHDTIGALAPTSPGAAEATLAAHKGAFARAGLAGAWPKVAALVVQPGVEFDHTQVIDYQRERTEDLRAVIVREPGMVFEAHSTDYQTPRHLRQLVEDHWAILKVGPGLTFALREALMALSHIERLVVPVDEQAGLFAVLEADMLAHPDQWAPYYSGTAAEGRLARRFSYSDRARYYWPDPALQTAQATLFAALERYGMPLALVSQYLPRQYWRIRNGELNPDPRELVIDKVRDVLRAYSRACRPPIRDSHGGNL